MDAFQAQTRRDVQQVREQVVQIQMRVERTDDLGGMQEAYTQLEAAWEALDNAVAAIKNASAVA